MSVFPAATAQARGRTPGRQRDQALCCHPRPPPHRSWPNRWQRRSLVPRVRRPTVERMPLNHGVILIEFTHGWQPPRRPWYRPPKTPRPRSRHCQGEQSHRPFPPQPHRHTSCGSASQNLSRHKPGRARPSRRCKTADRHGPPRLRPDLLRPRQGRGHRGCPVGSVRVGRAEPVSHNRGEGGGGPGTRDCAARV